VRSDGSATYQLANTVDDVAQGISLVCRGEDLLSVTPRQVLLADLLVADGLIDDALAEVGLAPREAGWDVPRAFAHLPMVVGMDRKKLSKRHGSVAIQEFRRQGFLPGDAAQLSGAARLVAPVGGGAARRRDDDRERSRSRTSAARPPRSTWRS
jgi:glutamyl/glutaminyl-tRNA synthetase